MMVGSNGAAFSRHILWCLLCANLALVACSGSSKGSASSCQASQTDVKVATFNIHFAEKGVAEVTNTLVGLHADVIGLQEVDQNTVRGHNVDQPAVFSSALGYSSTFVQEAAVPGGGAEGLLILSRWPLSNIKSTLLEQRYDFKFTLLQAQVDAPAPIGSFNFATTHLSWISEEDRSRQVGMLIPLIQNQTRLILVGDFNDSPESAAIAQLRPILNSAVNNTVTFPGSKKQIDYIFTSHDLTTSCPTVDGNAESSDHLPVSVNVRL